jgi:hypothetical protein
MQVQNSWFVKFWESILVVIAICNTILFALNFFPWEIIGQYWWKLYEVLQLTVLALGFVCIFFAIYWHVKEKKGTINSGLLHGWLMGIIRYWLAFSISSYGFAKIMGTQFNSPHYRNDMVIGQLSGFQLTWNYFGHSYTLSVIIGLCQILGSVLLLFRKTELLGTLILLPVMINICLINMFFGIPTLAFVLSILYTLALTYLLLLRWDDLILVLWKSASKIRPLKLGILKPIAQVLVIGLAFTPNYLAHSRYPTNVLEGKWKVDQFIRNGDTINDDTWIKDQTVWKNIYVEKFGKMKLCPNPYVYEHDRAQEADFKFDSSKKELQVLIQTGWTVIDTMLVRVSEYNKKHMLWNTVFKTDTLVLKLIKEN